MIKKLTLSVLTLVIGGTICLATSIDSKEAQKVAATFYSRNSKKVINQLSLTYTHMSATGVPVYYVYSINQADGYVVVPANDAQPILDYATQGTYNNPKNAVANNDVVIDKWSASAWVVTPKVRKG